MRKTACFIVALITIWVLLGGCGNVTLHEMSEENQENEILGFSLESVEENESNFEIVDKFEWEYNESNNFTLGFTKDKDSGIFSVSAFGHHEDGNIVLAQNDYIVILQCPIQAE